MRYATLNDVSKIRWKVGEQSILTLNNLSVSCYSEKGVKLNVQDNFKYSRNYKYKGPQHECSSRASYSLERRAGLAGVGRAAGAGGGGAAAGEGAGLSACDIYVLVTMLHYTTLLYGTCEVTYRYSTCSWLYMRDHLGICNVILFLKL